jgi:hypothetical protein
VTVDLSEEEEGGFLLDSEEICSMQLVGKRYSLQVFFTSI